MNYEVHKRTTDIADTTQILLDLYNAIGQATLDQIVGPHDINISITPAKTDK